MALRLTTVRLLIADDVGIGKTIEAGLIARELIDRGEVARLAVLCPPHLVEQWQGELQNRFNLQAVALTSASASRIERDLPHGVGLFDQHPIVVVSLDYIKSERHREHFLSIAPECIIVDEAHTCASSGAGKQLRFELLQRLAKDTERHLLLLTATPHSGDEAAFYNLLSLLDPAFVGLQSRTSADDPLRQQLARHFVQRRRKDIVEWQAETHDGRGFARRMKTELTYKLTGDWGAFFDAVQTYCREMAESVEQTQQGSARLIWYATLALLRCVASSPAAAVKALTTRLEGKTAALDSRRRRPARRRPPARRRRRRPAWQRPGARRPAGRNPHRPARRRTPAGPHRRGPAPLRQSWRPQARRPHRPHGGPGQRRLCPRGVLPLRRHRTLRGRRAQKTLPQSAGGRGHRRTQP
jgi:hypothetical protein